MGSILGILLIELKVYGISLRTPLLSFIFSGRELWGKILLAALLSLAYASLFLDSSISIAKVNIITFVVTVFGAWVMLQLSISKNTSNALVINSIKIIPILFLFLVILQILDFGIWVPLFSENYKDFYPRVSGLSSEPSFFANMLFFAFILYFGNCRKDRLMYSAIFGFMFFATASWSVAIYFLLLAFVLVLFKFKLGRIKVTPLFILILVPISLIMVERLFFFFSGESLTHEIFKFNPSWREISFFSSIYGADMIGPFSGGEGWEESLIRGQSTLASSFDIMTWIVWPWSFFSMLLVEFGIIPTAIIIFLIGLQINVIWHRDKNLRNDLRWYTAGLCIGIFLAPKWCVYFFFYPIYKVSSKRLTQDAFSEDKSNTKLNLPKRMG